MVDTGAFATLLHSQFVLRMKIPLRQTKYRSIGVNLAQSRVRLANIQRFSVGSMDMRSHSVGVINLQGLIHSGLLDASPPVAGLLGSEMLQRYHAIIDFGTNSGEQCLASDLCFAWQRWPVSRQNRKEAQ